MKRNELWEKLKEEQIPEDAYSLYGGLPNEKFCINKSQYWEVYYSERGLKKQLNRFNTEDEACECLYNMLHGIF